MTEEADLNVLRIKAAIELKKLEAEATAKEVSSKVIGKTAIPWIVILVVVGVFSAAYLPSESLPAVIGLVSTAVMAMISMLSGITGTKDKEEKPEFMVIKNLIERLDRKEDPVHVAINDGKVTVTKGHDTVKTSME